MELIKAFLVGLSCGILFSLLGLPIPAPTALAGILGIMGIFIGYIIINYFIKAT